MPRLFDVIAPVYGLFFSYQKKQYNALLTKVHDSLKLNNYNSVIDVGCGTGALCAVLAKKGFMVTGIDPAEKMLDIAMKKPENRAVDFVQADILEGLPYPDKHFDFSTASYVAHGLKADARLKMYAEMKRISKHLVIIYDYNQKRSLPVDVIEWLEGGYYFSFIKNVREELLGSFKQITVIDGSPRTSLYVCVF